jgi:hypothetical protein
MADMWLITANIIVLQGNINQQRTLNFVLVSFNDRNVK